MAVDLNHTIVASRDQAETAAFIAGVLGLPEPVRYGPFLVVQTANGVSLDVADRADVVSQHYAFLVSESEFDEIWGRIRERGVEFYADPSRTRPGEINTNDGGRGLYFGEPSGHLLEIITRPYGSGG
jgi:catechol 2,3-dioxygenase-like lactoylglutathione lyase family enzyme